MAIANLLKKKKKILDPIKKDSEITTELINLKNNRAIEFLGCYFSNPELINSFIDINDLVFVDTCVKFILKKLMLPFEDIEQIFLIILLRKQKYINNIRSVRD